MVDDELVQSFIGCRITLSLPLVLGAVEVGLNLLDASTRSVVKAFGQAPRRNSFKRFANLVNLGKMSGIETAHRGAPIGFEGNKTFARQTLQRLANLCARHAALARDIGFDQSLAWVQEASPNMLT